MSVGSLLLCLIHWVLDLLASVSLHVTLLKRRVDQKIDWTKGNGPKDVANSGDKSPLLPDLIQE